MTTETKIALIILGFWLFYFSLGGIIYFAYRRMKKNPDPTARWGRLTEAQFIRQLTIGWVVMGPISAIVLIWFINRPRF